jgi:hypothetical protein
MANRDRMCRWPAVRIADVAFGKLDDCMQSTSISLGQRPIVPPSCFSRSPLGAPTGKNLRDIDRVGATHCRGDAYVTPAADGFPFSQG